jgi:hypothetical protein
MIQIVRDPRGQQLAHCHNPERWMPTAAIEIALRQVHGR